MKIFKVLKVEIDFKRLKTAKINRRTASSCPPCVFYYNSICCQNIFQTSIKINGVEVPAYKLDGIKDYYLLYATNTSTGNSSYYLYDTKENSVQRYDSTMLDTITREKDRYFALVIVLSCVCFLSMLFLLIEVNRDNKRKSEI